MTASLIASRYDHKKGYGVCGLCVSVRVVSYLLIWPWAPSTWFVWFVVWDCGDGSWKKGTAPLPDAYGNWPFHLLIACHCRYSGLDLNCPVINSMASASPLAFAMFALAAASAWTTFWLAITRTALRLFCSVRNFWNATTFCSICSAKDSENLKSVMNTFSTKILFEVSVFLIAWAMTPFAVSLFVTSSSALNLATLALTAS